MRFGRRRFIRDAATGLMVPFVGILRAATPIIQTPSRGVVVTAGGGSAPSLVSTATLNVDPNADDPESFSITTGAITNGAVLAYFTMRKSNYVSACTFDGTAMAALAQVTDIATGTLRVEIWGLKLASKGAGTYTIAPSGTSGGHFKGIANTWNGVNQTTPFGTGVTGSPAVADNAPTVNITSNANDIVVAVVGVDGTYTFTAGSGFTTIANSSTAADMNHLSEYKQAATVANASLNLTGIWGIAAVAIQP